MRRVEIGPYRLLRLVKRGGGGTVYVAHDQRLNRRVALKLIAVPPAREQRESAIAEAHALASLNHRSIVQIFDVIETRSHLALVMEYVPGTDLASLLERTSLDSEAALHLSVDLSSALSACHQSGIVHRDFKPANILLDPQGRIRLTDFGISLALAQTGVREETLEPAVPGSYLAMSPEHACGAPVDERSDLFALGLVMYRLLAGRHPFADADNELEMLQHIVSHPHRPLRDCNLGLPAALSDLVDSLLDKEPQGRPASAQVVRQQLLSVIRALPASRGNVVSGLVATALREDDDVATELALPRNFSRGARSRLLSPQEWGPWASSMEGVPRRLATASLVLLAVVSITQLLVTAGPLARRGVIINPPLVMGLGEADLQPDAESLALILGEGVDAMGRIDRVAEISAASEQLDLHVNCNPYLCGILLSRQTRDDTASDYRTLLPDAPARAWRAQILASLDRVYAD